MALQAAAGVPLQETFWMSTWCVHGDILRTKIRPILIMYPYLSIFSVLNIACIFCRRFRALIHLLGWRKIKLNIKLILMD